VLSYLETCPGAIAPDALHRRESEPSLVIRDLAGADAIAKEWDRIGSASAWESPIQQYVWSRIYAEVFGLDQRLRVVASGGGPCGAIAPLFRPSGLFRSVELIGVADLFEVMDFVYSESSDLDRLAAALVAQGSPIVLRRIRADSPALIALRQACAGEWLTFCSPSKGCPYINLDESWSEPEQHINSGRRSDLRRARRAAEKIAPVTCELVVPVPAQVPALLEEAYRVEADSWKGRRGTALQADKRLGEFYRRYAIAMAERGELRVCFLRIGGQLAAMQIAVVTGSRFWLLKIGYSDEYAKCSPGILLMVETIRAAARAGLRSYEFLGAAETWIRNWTPLEYACVSFRAYPLTIVGIAAWARDAAPAIGRRLRNRGKQQ
jgi:CelD/BcsL family acetyltransferase involved in cellulose biosynthesis